MSRPLFTNNASTVLARAITPTDTILQLTAGTGQYFPQPTIGDYFMLTLVQVNNPEVSEIVECIERVGDVLTVVRGQEGTQPQIFNISDSVELRITAGSLNLFAIGGGGGGSASGTSVADFTATQGQTVFTLPFSYTQGIDNLAIFINGSKQVVNVNYTESTSTSFTMASGLNAGDVVQAIYNLPLAGGVISSSNVTYNEQSTGAVNSTVQSKLQEIVSVFDFMSPAQIADVQAGTMTQDVTTAINNAIAALPQTTDVYFNWNGNQYSGHPGPILYFPAGTYKVTSSIVIQKNNVVLRGDGWDNSIIKFAGTGTVQGVVRFLNALSCEMSDMGIDGGLPYNPTLTETYGADAGLICDLTPFFTSRNLWIANTRLSGLVAIHLWESFFENLQVRNTGYFTNETTPVKGAAIYFCADPAIKQSSNALGSGYESDNTVFVKAKLVPVGAVVLCEAPTQNITLIEPITENRDFATYFAALSYTKYTITSANNFKIQGGYFYGHEHSYACNSTLFNINSGLPGIEINNFYCLTANPTVGYHPEVTKIINAGGVNSFGIHGLVIDDTNAALTTPITVLYGSGYVGTMDGDIFYSANSTVAASALFTTNSLNNYRGTVTSNNTVSNTANQTRYDCSAPQYDNSNGLLMQSFRPRAWVYFDGTTTPPTILGSGNVSGVTKNATGVYTVTFAQGMPDANYATVASSTATHAGEIASPFNQGQSTVQIQNAAGATAYDNAHISVMVMR